MSLVAFPWVSGVVEEVETELHQAALSEAASKSRMLVINTRVHYCHTDTSSQVAFPTKLVNSSHDMGVVIAFVARSIAASEAARGNTTAD